MSWVRVDDNFPDHPKTMALGSLRREAGFLHIEATCYASRFLTDGLVPGHVVKGYPKRLVAALIAAGFWEQAGDGAVTIHDYLVYQPSREVVLAQREATRARVSGHRNARGNALQPRTSTHDGNAAVTAPRPVPSRPPTTESAHALSYDGERMGTPKLDQRAIKALEDRTGEPWSRAGDKQLGEYDRLVGVHGLTAVTAAFDGISGGRKMTARQLVWAAVKVLEPIPSMREAEIRERDDEVARNAAKRRPLTVAKPVEDISDEEAERLARAYRASVRAEAGGAA